MKINFRKLKADEIECRIGTIKKDGSGLSILLYKDARCDMNILDETVGAMGWKRSHTRDNQNCIVSIYDEDKNEWVGKEDVGTQSNTEAEKGLASDSFKRACVNWGIGRELYTTPFIWVKAGQADIKQFNNKWTCQDKFHVEKITYKKNGDIDGLSIINDRTGIRVFAKKPTEIEKTGDAIKDAKEMIDNHFKEEK